MLDGDAGFGTKEVAAWCRIRHGVVPAGCGCGRWEGDPRSVASTAWAIAVAREWSAGGSIDLILEV